VTQIICKECGALLTEENYGDVWRCKNCMPKCYVCSSKVTFGTAGAMTIAPGNVKTFYCRECWKVEEELRNKKDPPG
jgi:hypothetical protein